MNEQELREMVRQSIARQRSDAGLPRRSPAEWSEGGAASHVSAAFFRFPLVRSGDDDGHCIIEPAVRCNHCGYCQSLGH
jgi:hypothetical protein